MNQDLFKIFRYLNEKSNKRHNMFRYRKINNLDDLKKLPASFEIPTVLVITLTDDEKYSKSEVLSLSVHTNNAVLIIAAPFHKFRIVSTIPVIIKSAHFCSLFENTIGLAEKVNNTIALYGNSTLITDIYPLRIVAHETATVHAYNRSIVYTYHKSKAFLFQFSQVFAHDQSEIHLFDYSIARVLSDDVCIKKNIGYSTVFISEGVKNLDIENINLNRNQLIFGLTNTSNYDIYDSDPEGMFIYIPVPNFRLDSKLANNDLSLNYIRSSDSGFIDPLSALHYSLQFDSIVILKGYIYNNSISRSLLNTYPGYNYTQGNTRDIYGDHIIIHGQCDLNGRIISRRSIITEGIIL